MLDTKKLAADLSSKINYQPTYDWLLVKPLKPVMVTKLVPVAPKQTMGSIDEAENSQPTEPTKQKVEANIAKGVIIKLGTEYEKTNPEGLEVGDVVLFPNRAGVAFELLKDSRLLRRYEIIGRERV
jgi:hypothetical protein